MSTLNVDALVGNTSANAITVRGEGTATTSLQQGLAKSWCKWEAIGTASVSDSFNHSSLTDNGTGDQTITISSAMANLNFAFVGMAGDGNTNLCAICQPQGAFATTTTATRYQTAVANISLQDMASISASLLGDLA
tara:strand:- start:42 stop:449 length:408 start_codon:yes stop_codon:yes gene_type:complete